MCRPITLGPRALALGLALFWALNATAQTADERYRAAASDYAAGNYETALEQFARLAGENSQSPRAPEARFYAAEAALQLDQLASSRDHYAAFLKDFPEHRLAKDALLRRSELNLALGEVTAAKTDCELFLESYPNDPRSGVCQLRLGQALETLQDFAAAQTLYTSLIKAGGATAWPARVGLGRVLQRHGHSAEAARTLTALPWPADGELAGEATYWTALAWMTQKKPREAVDLIDRMLENQPGIVGADKLEYCAGLAWQQAGDRASATDRFQRVARDWPESHWLDDALKARVQMAFETNDYELARQLSDEFLTKYEHSPHRDAVLQYRGRVEAGLRHFVAAENIFRGLIDTSSKGDEALPATAPTLASHWYYLAETQVADGRYIQGLQSLQMARDTRLGEDLDAAAISTEALAQAGLKKHSQAIKLLTDWLKANGQQSDAGICRRQLALLRAAAGQFPLALEEVERWYRADPNQLAPLETTHSIAEIAYRQGNFPVALKCFEKLSVEGLPRSLQTRGLAGAALTKYAMGDRVASATTLEELLKQFPNYPFAAEVSYRRAQTLEQSQMSRQALEAYRLTARTYPDSPEAPAALAAIGRLCRASLMPGEALHAYRELAEKYPDYEERDDALAQWATLLDAQGDATQADQVYMRLQLEYPHSRYAADVLARAAKAAAKQGDKEAAKIVQRWHAAATDPADRRQAAFLLGQMATKAGQWNEVETWMQKALDAPAADPQRREAEFWLAEAAWRLGKLELAAERFAQVEADGSEQQEAWLAKAPLRRAQILVQTKEFAAAEDVAMGIPERFPEVAKSADYLLVLGRCHAGQGRHDDARAVYESVASAPADAQTEAGAMAQWLIGESYLAESRYADALEAYEPLNDRTDQPRWQAAALMQSGKCLEALGRNAAAVKAYERLLAEHHSSPWTVDAQRRLKAVESNQAADRGGRTRR